MDELGKALQTFFINVEFAKCWLQIIKLKSIHTGKNKLMFY